LRSRHGFKGSIFLAARGGLGLGLRNVIRLRFAAPFAMSREVREQDREPQPERNLEREARDAGSVAKSRTSG